MPVVDNKNRQEFLKSVRKNHAAALEQDDRRDAVSTGSYAVDVITGIGGFPRGRISEVSGPFSSGKTTLALTACAAAQAAGLYPVYLDVERALDLHHAARLGVNFSDAEKGLFAAPGTAEEALQMVYTAAEHKADIVFVDSVAAMVTKDEMEGEIGDAGPIAQRARVLSRELPRLLGTIAMGDTAVVFINQLRSTMSQYGPAEETAGGKALKFYTSLRITLKQTQRSSQKRKTRDFLGKEREIPVASMHEAEILKSKVSSPFARIEFTIRFDDDRQVYGIDNVLTLLDAGKAAGVITTSGSWFHFGDVKVQGDAALYSKAITEPGFIQAVKQGLIDKGILKWLAGA